ncbi:MAG: hypothetical protein MZV63_41520 [Marinilabiliales bacterium]|nr:hypothetical protein [Marinilabiliales bacterium]
MLITGLDPEGEYYFSVANVANDFESLFCTEFTVFPVGIKTQVKKDWGLQLRQNTPNPFRDRTTIGIELDQNISYPNSSLVIADLSGRIVSTLPVDLRPGLNRVEFTESAAV